MRARIRTGRTTSLIFVSSLAIGLVWTHRAAAQTEEEAAPPPPAAPEVTPDMPPEQPPPPRRRKAEPAEQAPAPEPGAPTSFRVESNGWTFSLEGRLNSFFSYGWGNYLPTNAPDGDMTGLIGGGYDVQLQRDSTGNFHTPRIRNGFLANVLTFNLSRKIFDTTTMSTHLSLWSDVETNLQVYADVLTWMQEGYMKLEGPWGSFTAGRQLALFGRGAVEVDFNYMHGYGLGLGCNVDGVHPSCGMIGFGVLFPFFRSGMVYATPSLGGFVLSGGAFDPVILAGKWERVIMPTLQAEAAFTLPFRGLGMLKLFASGIYQELGAAGNPPSPGGMPDTRPLAHKTVKQYGGAGGLRLEIGPIRFGAVGHIGQGLGFAYAQENTQAAYYNAPDTSDTRDGDLRTFRGFYGQLMAVLGKIDVAVGAGASQLLLLSFEKGNDPMIPEPHVAKQQRGISAGVFIHLDDHLVLGLDYMDALYSWWATTFTQHVRFANAGLTMTF
jgi:hypothetical protein